MHHVSLILGCPSGQILNCYHWSRARRGPKDHQHCSCVRPLENQYLVKLKPTMTMFSGTFQSKKLCRVNEPVARKRQKVAIDFHYSHPTAPFLLLLTPSFYSSTEPREGDSASLCRPVWTLWCGFCAAPRADRPLHEKQPAGDALGPGCSVWTAGGQSEESA